MDSISAARKVLVRSLRNLAGARFARERIVPGRIVCGLVNVRRASGRYTGWRRFYATGKPLHVRIDLAAFSVGTVLKTASRLPAAVSYEYLWTAAGCRDEG